jgi:hypothetical protein
MGMNGPLIEITESGIFEISQLNKKPSIMQFPSRKMARLSCRFTEKMDKSEIREVMETILILPKDNFFKKEKNSKFEL